MNKLSDKARIYARSYGQPPYGREIEGTAELLLQMAERLEKYEELEVQGKLLKLPCAVGDIVYQLMVTGVNEDSKRLKYKMFKAKVFRFSVDSFTLCFMTEIIDENKYHSELPLSSFGKTVFLTREEAKSALKELNGEVS